MRKCFLILLLLAAGQLSLQAGQKADTSACAQIEQALQDFGRIKTGMMRHDVERYFTLDGGMNFRLQTYYVYRKCDLIKIEVTFESDPDVKDKFSDRDKITKLSKLYLDYPSKD